MFIDAFMLLSDTQAVTTTAVSTNTIDLGLVTPRRDIAVGESMGIAVAIEVAADFTTGDETYTVEVIQSAAADLSSPTVIASRVLTAAQRALGTLLFVPIGDVTARYLGVRYTQGGTTPICTYSAWLTSRALFSKAHTYYAKNYAQ